MVSMIRMLDVPIFWNDATIFHTGIDLSQLGEAFNVTTLSFSIPGIQAKLHQAAGILVFLAAILAFVSLLGKNFQKFGYIPYRTIGQP